MPKNRPRYLNLKEIKQPIPAIISILHRVSGVLLFFPGIPILLYSLEMFLGSLQGYTEIRFIFELPQIKFSLIALFWFFTHHLCAGIRHLALDLNYGLRLEYARNSSKMVLVVGFFITLFFGVMIW
ncbi:MAG: succinate dehydrogenase, cytochrome b556 subunit [Nitrosospira sp.]|nr:succinate dehydrogenase, cytochrome b556 subunit [Nitrosospira sp.]MDW7643049.1 succinate dehydrogenase, cytochrome b556 subunit [Nitrosomonadaceae bacterium]MBI0407399.1 succinate dehydrogenase, cytochrome b556 subunit [Nitrosospira sp.]MBI0414405.1 succinate dehydrogenase, cytochrome b556 subunit [Nitrosospira sp.]MBI0416952.1 succinate dehydrogenase, cytochrome b556 subunit [Nitrosospira sp.]